MERKTIDLRSQICPYPVVQVVETVESMSSDIDLVFLVDDPLAIKSIPEELSQLKDLTIDINKCNSFWEINIVRRGS